VKKGWVVRWGGDLGLGEDIFGTPREEGQARLRVHFRQLLMVVGWCWVSQGY